MAVKIEDVPKWMTMYKDGNRSHVVMCGGMGHLSHTARGTITHPQTITDKPGKRLCRKCVAALKNIVPMPMNADGDTLRRK